MLLNVSNSSLVKVAITKIRDKNTNSKEFSENIKKITLELMFRASNELELTNIDIETPISACKSPVFLKPITIVPILRAGSIMADAIKDLFENSSVGHIGLYRDNNLNIVKYYEKMPNNVVENSIILCDPLIATGNTVISAMDLLKKYQNKKIILLGIIASKTAIDKITKEYPYISVYVATVDEKLNDKGYIVPGLGDAGDRIFGTIK